MRGVHCLDRSPVDAESRLRIVHPRRGDDELSAWVCRRAQSKDMVLHRHLEPEHLEIEVP